MPALQAVAVHDWTMPFLECIMWPAGARCSNESCTSPARHSLPVPDTDAGTCWTVLLLRASDSGGPCQAEREVRQARVDKLLSVWQQQHLPKKSLFAVSFSWLIEL
jgi:hypothetical protein